MEKIQSKPNNKPDFIEPNPNLKSLIHVDDKGIKEKSGLLTITNHSDLKKTLIRKKCAWLVTIMGSFYDI